MMIFDDRENMIDVFSRAYQDAIMFGLSDYEVLGVGYDAVEGWLND